MRKEQSHQTTIFLDTAYKDARKMEKMWGPWRDVICAKCGTITSENETEDSIAGLWCCQKCRNLFPICRSCLGWHRETYPEKK